MFLLNKTIILHIRPPKTTKNRILYRSDESNYISSHRFKSSKVVINSRTCVCDTSRNRGTLFRLVTYLQLCKKTSEASRLDWSPTNRSVVANWRVTRNPPFTFVHVARLSCCLPAFLVFDVLLQCGKLPPHARGLSLLFRSGKMRNRIPLPISKRGEGENILEHLPPCRFAEEFGLISFLCDLCGIKLYYALVLLDGNSIYTIKITSMITVVLLDYFYLKIVCM